MTPPNSVVLLGAPLAASMTDKIRDEIAARGLDLGLAIVMIGDNKASETYVQKKIAACEKVGIRAWIERLSTDSTQEDLHALLHRLNNDARVTGYIVQLPLPSQLSIQTAVQEMAPHKDVDGFTALNAGRLFLGGDGRYMPPATSHAVIELLKGYDIPLAGKHIVVVGRSNLVGKPLAVELLDENATVTICHSKTTNLAEHTRQADILISAVGKLHLITGDMVKDGVVLVDVGFNMTTEGLFGDIDEEAIAKSSAHAPVPGGVGSVTVAQLIANVVRAHELSLQ